MRSLEVFYQAHRVGTLVEDGAAWRFSYADDWINSEQRFDLSPALPVSAGTILDGASLRPVQWYFDNLLPEEALRQVVAAEAGLKWEDAFGLLAHYGAESAGALVLRVPGDQGGLRAGRRALEDAALNDRILNLPSSSLQKGSPKRMSLAGAQHKMLIILDEGKLYEPEPDEPSTHILKPNHPGPGYAASVMNEYFTMRLAAAMGLDVPMVSLRYVPEPVYMVERFDRWRDNTGCVHRRHLVDTCQLLNKDRAFKYSGANLESLSKAIGQCRSKAAARLGLFRWLVFNVLVGNGDNHLKNLSFLVDHEGIRLAPAYDLLSTAVYETPALAPERRTWPASELAFSINGRTQFVDVGYDDLRAAGATLGLAKATFEREIERQITGILCTAEALFEQICEEHTALVDSSPDSAAARRHWGIEQTVVRAIVHVVLKDMVSAVAPR